MENKKILIWVLFISLFVLGSCRQQQGAVLNSSTKESPSEKKEEHLNYKNQKDWDFESGKSQSPINIETSIAETMIDEGEIKIN